MTMEILSNAQMRAADAAAIAEGVPGIDLMEAAGAACADAIIERWPGRRVVVACGPGNNGGDGFVIAHKLATHGYQVALGLLGDKKNLSGDAAIAASQWSGEVSTLADLELDEDCVLVDALFGTGLSRPIEGEARAFLERVRKINPRVLAVDLPSGLNGDAAQLGGVYVRADLTVTFVRKKPVHILEPSASACGAVRVANIGVRDEIIQGLNVQIAENDPSLWRHKLVWPNTGSHKHQRGRLAVATGGVGQTGAARLAARAGLRVGAGLVTLLTPPSALMVAAAASTSVMTESIADADAIVTATSRSTVVVIGPSAGVSDATRDKVLALANAGRSLVLDADALTVFASDPDVLFSALPTSAVLTPHQGEFDRLFPGVATSATNKIAAVQEAARRSGAIVLLKGADTVMASPSGQSIVNTHASPFLATAGSGDVLAGLIGGLMAQGVDPFEAACAAAWMHGDIGVRLGPGLIAEDLCDALPQTLKALYEAAAVPSR
ncbi:MAG: NAD(P)H-hydrate dehydratase [Pseudomonadota bacterium]